VMGMFNAFCAKKSSTINFKQTLRAMCAFGVGAKIKQAEALFTICDEDGAGSVTRSELLKFIAGSLPEDSGQHKTETFAKVGRVFLLLDEDGTGEIDKDEWCRGIANKMEVYQAFQTMNPYRKFFKYWNEKDFSLQNLLTAAYFCDDPTEQKEALHDRVILLGQKVDEDGSGILEFEETMRLMEAMGLEEEDAIQGARRLCGKKGMSLRKFTEVFKELAARDMRKFYFIERSYGLAGAAPRPPTRSSADDEE